MAITRTSASRCTTINPLVGLSPAAFRLYGALEVFRDTFYSRVEREWFRAPQLRERLRPLGFSNTEIHQELEALVRTGLLQIRDEGRNRWYRLK